MQSNSSLLDLQDDQTPQDWRRIECSEWIDIEAYKTHQEDKVAYDG